MNKYFLIIWLAIQPFAGFCQVDSLYQEARLHAFNNRYEEANHDLDTILSQYPEHYDALFLQTMIMAWSGEYYPALRQLNFIINKFSPTEEAMEAIARINYWSGENIKAIITADKGLSLFPENLNLLYIRAQALAAQNQYEDAIASLDTLLQEKDDYQEAQDLRQSLQILKLKNAVGIEYTHSRFSNTFTPWHQATAYYQRKLPNTLLIGRIQYAHMFDQQGIQVEADAYPKIDTKTYAYLNAGVSNATIFPKVRWGAELYRLLPHQWEASAGMRGLYFQAVPIHIYTVQLGRYFPAYWISARAFMSSLENQQQFTGLLTARRYLGHKDRYTTFYLGSGATPLKINSLAEVQRLDASWISVDYQHPLWERRWIIRSTLEVQQELYPEIRATDRVSFTIRLERRF